MNFNTWRSFEPSRLYKARVTDLSVEELLARALRSARAARFLLESFESIEVLARASPEELVRVHLIGTARAEQLLACLELGRRLSAPNEQNRAKMSSPDEVVDFLGDMKYLDHEEFRVILLNTKNRVLRVFTVSMGSVNASIVHPREVLKPAISASAAGIILAHNHPTGDPAPSKEDIDLTERFSKCCELVGIDLIDHIIIGDGRYCSMREHGNI